MFEKKAEKSKNNNNKTPKKTIQRDTIHKKQSRLNEFSLERWWLLLRKKSKKNTQKESGGKKQKETQFRKKHDIY